MQPVFIAADRVRGDRPGRDDAADDRDTPIAMQARAPQLRRHGLSDRVAHLRHVSRPGFFAGSLVDRFGETRMIHGRHPDPAAVRSASRFSGRGRAGILARQFSCSAWAGA